MILVCDPLFEDFMGATLRRRRGDPLRGATHGLDPAPLDQFQAGDRRLITVLAPGDGGGRAP